MYVLPISNNSFLIYISLKLFPRFIIDFIFEEKLYRRIRKKLNREPLSHSTSSPILSSNIAYFKFTVQFCPLERRNLKGAFRYVKNKKQQLRREKIFALAIPVERCREEKIGEEWKRFFPASVFADCFRRFYRIRFARSCQEWHQSVVHEVHLRDPDGMRPRDSRRWSFPLGNGSQALELGERNTSRDSFVNRAPLPLSSPHRSPLQLRAT